MRPGYRLFVLVYAGMFAAAPPPPAPPPPGDPSAGEMLAKLGNCASCHTAEEGAEESAPYAGGYALETRFGVFRGPNITPDPTHGIGRWTFHDFYRAMRRGRRPDGRPYYPAFPYPSYTLMTDADLRDLWAYLQTISPSDRANEPHTLQRGARNRSLLGLWRLVAFRKGPFEARPHEPSNIARGRYLGEAVGHCGDCHTPRTRIGRPKARWSLAGQHEPPEPAPNITPHPDGIGEWSTDDITTFLEYGMTPAGDFVGGEMMQIVEEGTAPLSAEDREALAAWLQAVPPKPTPKKR